MDCGAQPEQPPGAPAQEPNDAVLPDEAVTGTALEITDETTHTNHSRSVVLLGVAALSSMKRGANPSRSQSAGRAVHSWPCWMRSRSRRPQTKSPPTRRSASHRVLLPRHGPMRNLSADRKRSQRWWSSRQFSAELAANRLVFTSVNYELPENAHFLTDYKLPCPSLVLVAERRQGGELEAARRHLAIGP